MTQPSRLIYLPPGVAAVPAAPVTNNGAPFDRNFFENVLPPAIAAFCSQVNCEVPVVELTTIDGVRHYVNGISGVSDQWVALQTSSPDHEHPTQVFIPYQTIFRVEIHPEHDARRHRLGFLTDAAPPARRQAGQRGRARTAAEKSD
ncbi:hypothetical protein O0235_13600 [Tepidiforma flava]|uniref:Uncharacterized protein n=1 Tax=Tepidiforma flava TaxID=3004094 RepID=A0ABY7M6Z8_9CHLR|nr:hypothetical protein [Tepidiforma flava]WBL35788.1 hypothetical protein O0235_13600 [Tepidiforma flava]